MLKKLHSEQLQVVIEGNPTCTTREMSKIFKVSRHMTKYREMKRHGWEGLKDRKMALPPHNLSEINKQQSVICCVSLCSCELQAPFLD
ncbi:unnamed protein product [Hymenolepis diminuta]|uniref:Uncharacterized protein n=1 Tax=Hymenolepis diminuta TaxID=6216 RepID=A0A564YEB9_HYMDI|nr:unnamed protein product [Hymenolepis diminuta]VUZ45627.1 unnamed protein product [Hymenolepis diminuta]